MLGIEYDILAIIVIIAIIASVAFLFYGGVAGIDFRESIGCIFLPCIKISSDRGHVGDKVTVSGITFPNDYKGSVFFSYYRSANFVAHGGRFVVEITVPDKDEGVYYISVGVPGWPGTNKSFVVLP